LEIAKHESVFSLYRKAKSIFRKYNDQDDHKLTLLAVDTVWSYFQDRFATTHYDAIIGDNGSGKSTVGDTFEATGYRAVNLTDPNATNLFRILGTVEPGQCTIIADESDKIEESAEMMSILKSGYHRSKKVVRTNSNTWMQEYFFPYCFKIIIAERSPSKSKAKGVLERTFIIHTYEETPDYDIKEVLNAEGEGHDDNELQALLSELREFRKLMLVYRLLHFNDPVVNTDIGLKGRNKELCKPTLQLFVSSSSFSDSKDNIQSLTEIRDALQTFIDAKHKRKTTDAIETALYPIIVNAISECGKSVSVSNLWQSITQSIDGVSNPNTPHIYETLDYGPIYRNTFTNVICDKFGAIRDRRGKTRTLIFDIDKVHKTGAVYNGRESKIKLDLLEQHNVDSYDSNDNITEVLNHPNKETDVKNRENEVKLANNLSNNQSNPINPRLEESQKDPSSSLELSELSCRHGQNLEEFSCYYCSGFQTDSEEEYMRHCAIKHPKKPFQPTKADLERHGLKPQGKSWEI
jgi:hypothetical protein